MKQYGNAPRTLHPLPSLRLSTGKELSSATVSFSWHKWRCSKSVFRKRIIKGFQQIIGILYICSTLTSCCESLIATVQ